MPALNGDCRPCLAFEKVLVGAAIICHTVVTQAEEPVPPPATPAAQSAGGTTSLANLRGMRKIVPLGWKASWSPDATRLVFGKPQGGGLQILHLASGEVTNLTDSGKDAAWSPDGRYVAYVKEPSYNEYRAEEVWLVPPTGESPRKVADGGFPSWSADGNFKEKQATAAIMAVCDKNPAVRRLATQPLRRQDTPAAARALGELLSDDDASLQRGVRSALRRMRTPEAKETLQRAEQEAAAEAAETSDE